MESDAEKPAGDGSIEATVAETAPTEEKQSPSPADLSASPEAPTETPIADSPVEDAGATESPTAANTPAEESAPSPDIEEMLAAHERATKKRRAPGTTLHAADEPIEVKKTRGEVPAKFRNGKKPKRGQRPTHYMADALAMATPEDKKLVKEYYTDYIIKHAPKFGQSPLMPAFEALALHAFIHGKTMLDPPWYMSAGIAAIPLGIAAFNDFGDKLPIGPKVVQETPAEIKARILSVVCPICGAAPNDGCHNPSNPDDKAPEGKFHQERMVAARK